MSNTIYVPQTWIDEANSCTPITADRLNHMEQGIKACSDAWDSISSRLDLTTLDKVSFTRASTNAGIELKDANNKTFAFGIFNDGRLIIQYVNSSGQTVYRTL